MALLPAPSWLEYSSSQEAPQLNQDLPHRKAFTGLLTRAIPFGEAVALIEAASEKYPYLLDSLPIRSPRSRLERRVLPILALYQACLDRGMESPAALVLIQPVMLEAYFGHLHRGITLLNRLPVDMFTLLRPLLRKMAASECGAELIADTPTNFEFHAHQCAIWDTLKALDTPELTLLFCASDDWLAEALPRLLWLRTTTLAQGGSFCDFHWARRDTNCA
jgi:hypothetical protein